MGQPSIASLQSGFESNYDPSIQDWQKAYQPVDKALNKAFETRITNKNARQVQFELAVVSLYPTCMLTSDLTSPFKVQRTAPDQHGPKAYDTMCVCVL